MFNPYIVHAMNNQLASETNFAEKLASFLKEWLSRVTSLRTLWGIYCSDSEVRLA